MQSSSQKMTVISFGGWPLRSTLSDPCDWLCWQQEGTPTSVLPATSSQEPQPQLHSSFQEGQSGYKLWTLGISSPGPGACGPGKSPGPGGRTVGCPGLDGPLGPPHATLSSQHDVRTACSLRTQFLQSLLSPQAQGGSVP